MNLLIYLHGFNSAPASPKAQLCKNFFEERNWNFLIPELNYAPKNTLEYLEKIINENSFTKLAFIGSSMGGFFSTYFCELRNVKAALINPATAPYRFIHDNIGTHINPYTQKRFEVLAEHENELIQMDIKIKNPQNYLVLIKKGDEVLNYKEAEKKYSNSHLLIDEGGDHSFHDLEKYLETIYDFLN